MGTSKGCPHTQVGRPIRKELLRWFSGDVRHVGGVVSRWYRGLRVLVRFGAPKLKLPLFAMEKHFLRRQTAARNSNLSLPVRCPVWGLGWRCVNWNPRERVARNIDLSVRVRWPLRGLGGRRVDWEPDWDLNQLGISDHIPKVSVI